MPKFLCVLSHGVMSIVVFPILCPFNITRTRQENYQSTNHLLTQQIRRTKMDSSNSVFAVVRRVRKRCTLSHDRVSFVAGRASHSGKRTTVATLLQLRHPATVRRPAHAMGTWMRYGLQLTLTQVWADDQRCAQWYYICRLYRH